MKIGINASIDVSKIDKDRLYKGKKGTYLDTVIFIDVDNKDQYDQNGMITQNVSKEEKEQGEAPAAPQQTPLPNNDFADSDVPF